MICDFGCGQEALYKLKNGKWCCSSHYLKCLNMRNKRLGIGNPFYQKNHKKETKDKIRKSLTGEKNHRYGKQVEIEVKEKIRNTLLGKMIKEKNPFFGKKHSIKTIRLLKNKLIKSLDYYKEKYPLLLLEEEILEKKKGVFLVHCKNNNCKNSKENGGWFIPSYTQFHERLRNLESGKSYLYCSEECRSGCVLFRSRNGSIKSKRNYTEAEYQTFRQFVLERDNYICQFCDDKATDVHHEKPQKLEPFFSLDPDYAWSCCKKCHYEKGHKDNCSLGKLANKIC